MNFEIQKGEELETFANRENNYVFIGKSDKLKNGNFDVLILKTDAGGKIIWKKYFGEAEDDWGIDIIAAADGYIFIGSSGEKPFMAKIDEMGKLLWHKTFNEKIREGYFTSITVNPAGDIVATGQIHDDNDNNKKVFIVKMNSAGKEIKREGFIGTYTKNARGNKINFISENKYLVSGNLWKNGLLFTMNENLNPINIVTMNHKGVDEGRRLETVYSGDPVDTIRDWGVVRCAELYDFVAVNDNIYAIALLDDDNFSPMQKYLMMFENFTPKKGYLYSTLCRDFDMQSICKTANRDIFVSGDTCETPGLFSSCNNIILNVDSDLNINCAYSLKVGDYTRVIDMKTCSDGKQIIFGEFYEKEYREKNKYTSNDDRIKKYYILQTDNDFSILK
ncbi:MAG: hypothetical protein JXR81_05190 [Candidatus Goldbacteria bacterium]|nr:hypothetical protein [Candidatus Goldiibacteriota bacterium]